MNIERCDRSLVDSLRLNEPERPRQLIIDFCDSASDNDFRDTVDIIYSWFCTNVQRLMIHLNFDDNTGALCDLFARCTTLRCIEMDITHGIIVGGAIGDPPNLWHILQFTVYAQLQQPPITNIFFTGWSMLNLHNLRLENIAITEEIRSFILQHAWNLCVLELSSDYENIEGILARSIHLICIVLHIQRAIPPISSNSVQVLGLRGIQQVDFRVDDKVQQVLETITQLLTPRTMPSLVAIRFLDLNQPLIGMNMQSLKLWRSLVAITSSFSISVFDSDGYVIDEPILEGPKI